MTRWTDRPRITAAMLNPALIAALESAAARAYEKNATHPMPLPIAFVVAPLVLHRPTREALPRDTRTHLATWVSRQPLIRASFPRRARELVPFVREGVRFGLRHQILSLADGELRGTISGRVADGPVDLIKAAAFVGRWIAKSDHTPTTYALLGVAP